MAVSKLNFVGSALSILTWLLSDKKCLVCRKPVAFNAEFEVNHILPKAWFLANGMAVDNRIVNLDCLCKACNASKGKNGFDWVGYSEKVRLFHRSLTKHYVMAEGSKDCRQFVKTLPKSFDGKVIDKAVLRAESDAYAKAFPHDKFAKIHRNGIFWKARSELNFSFWQCGKRTLPKACQKRLERKIEA